jgi:uncharacterized protein
MTMHSRLQNLMIAPALKYARAPFAGRLTEEGTFAGYASLFGRVDLGNDRVAAGAFRDALAKRGVKGVRMLFQHDPNEVIGTWLDIREDATGLMVHGKINTEVARGREVLELIRDGALDGLSIGFKTVNASQDRKTGVRTILQADLWEISIVTFPMLPEARVSEVKAGRPTEPPLPSIREFEHWLTRDARLTRGQARSVIAKGFAATKRERDAAQRRRLSSEPQHQKPAKAPGAGLPQLASLIRKAAGTLNPRGQ